MDKNKRVDEFLKTNLKLRNAVEELKVLDRERAQIKQEFKNSETISKELEEKMQKNINDYENLLLKIKQLKKQND